MSSTEKSRILIMSMRNFDFNVGRALFFELEYAVNDFEQVSTLAPSFSHNRINKIAKRISQFSFTNTGNALPINPTFNQFSLEQEYDLFFFLCQYPKDLRYLNSIKDWRKKCRKAVCWLDEVWEKEVAKFKPQLTALKDFDCIFMNLNSSIKKVAEVAQKPCYYLPPGIDAIKFCPYPLQPQRSIDICAIGRRPASVHKSLLNLAEQEDFFYMYDTFKTLIVRDYNEHRNLYRNIIKRSRYFIAYKPKFDLINITNGQEELNARFFEGAAGGAVLLGIPPNCDAFNQNFDWKDAVIPLPEDATNTPEIIAELDLQPERLNKISIDNVRNSLLRHDWVYRWEKILDTVNIPHSSGMIQRKAKLKQLAEAVTKRNQPIN